MKPLRIIAWAFLVVVLLMAVVKVTVNSPPPPAGYSLDSLPRLGLDADGNFSDAVLSAAAGTGATVLRSHVSWTTIEPVKTDPPRYNWAPYDTIFSRQAANH